jgi:hypothetical protein
VLTLVTCLITALYAVTVEPVISTGITAAHTGIGFLITALYAVTVEPVINAGITAALTGIGIFITCVTVTELSIIRTGKRGEGAQQASNSAGACDHLKITLDQTRSDGLGTAGMDTGSPTVTNPDAYFAPHRTV